VQRSLLAGSLLLSIPATHLRKVNVMIEFILAGMLYLGIMFAVVFLLSFLTIGITFTAASFLKRLVYRGHQPRLAYK
jgi:phosphatidylglycerophosphate synthase